MTKLQWFLFAVLPLSIAVSGVIVGELFRATQLNSRLDESSEMLVDGSTLEPTKRTTSRGRFARIKIAVPALGIIVSGGLLAHIAGAVAVGAVALLASYIVVH